MYYVAGIHHEGHISIILNIFLPMFLVISFIVVSSYKVYILTVSHICREERLHGCHSGLLDRPLLSKKRCTLLMVLKRPFVRDIWGRPYTFQCQASWEIDLVKLIYSFTQKMVFKTPFMSATGQDSAHSLLGLTGDRAYQVDTIVYLEDGIEKAIALVD